MIIQDHFLGSSGVTGGVGNLFMPGPFGWVLSGVGTPGYSFVNVSGAPGLLRLTTTAGAADSCILTANHSFMSDDLVSVMYRFRISSVVTTSMIQLGAPATGGFASSGGVSLSRDTNVNTTLNALSIDGTGTDTLATNATMATNTFFTAQLFGRAAGAGYPNGAALVSDASGNLIYNEVHPLHLPAAGVACVLQIALTNRSAVAHTLDIDLCQLVLGGAL